MTGSPRVAVIGLGVIGAMTLWALAERGVAATGFEQYAVGHDRGASGGGTRLFRMLYAEGDQYLPLLEQSRRCWAELGAAAGRELFVSTTSVSVGQGDGSLVRAVLASARRTGLAHEVLDGAEFMRRHPQYRLDADEVVVVDPAGGLLRAPLCVVTAAQAAGQAGAAIRTRVAVREVRADAAGASVLTEHGADHFDQVVVTTGPWAARLLPEVPVRPRLLSDTWQLALAGDFGPGRFPPVIRRNPDRVSFAARPSLDGQRVRFGIDTSELDYTDLEGASRDVPADQVAAIEAAVPRCLNGVYPTVVRGTVYADGYTADGHPLIGRLPGRERVVVAAGFSGHGFKMAPAIGRLVAGIVLDNADTQVPATLAVTRSLS